MDSGPQHRKVGPGELAAVIGGGTLIGSLWGTWFAYVPGSVEKLGVGRIPRSSVAEAEADPLLSGWSALSGIDIALVALAALIVVEVIVAVLFGARAPLLVAALAAAGAAGLVVDAALHPAGTEMIGFSVDWGLTMALIGSLVGLAGALWAGQARVADRAAGSGRRGADTGAVAGESHHPRRHRYPPPPQRRRAGSRWHR